jgi:hypothetical protein
MKERRWYRAGLIALCVAILPGGAGVNAQMRPEKKIVEYGWDVPYPDFVQRHIRDMEKRPFDGIVFRTNGFDHAFDPTPWKIADFEPQLKTLAGIEWKSFTDNFLILYAANKWNMDWFNDAQWKGIATNMRLVSKAAKTGRCVGIVFDPEPYGENPWLYPGKNGGKSFAEVQAQVRKRGALFIRSLQSEMPDLVILSFFQLALFDPILDEPDLKVREEKWITVPWHSSLALVPAFFLGMLDAAGPGVRFVDGNEISYYYESSEEFFRGYHLMKQRVKALVPPGLRKKYDTQAEAGMALYIDQPLGTRGDIKTTGNFMTPADRLKFFEHNVYYALTTTDRYVWCYSERMSWWQNYTPGPGETAPQADALPAGVDEAVRSAVATYREGKPLDFDITDMIRAAREKKAASEANKK